MEIANGFPPRTPSYLEDWLVLKIDDMIRWYRWRFGRI